MPLAGHLMLQLLAYKKSHYTTIEKKEMITLKKRNSISWANFGYLLGTAMAELVWGGGGGVAT